MTTQHSYTIYRKTDSPDASRVEELLSAQGVSWLAEDTAKVVISHGEVEGLLERLGMWPIDLVDREHQDWQDGFLNEESDDREIVAFIVENFHVIKSPIVVKGDARAMLCDPPERVFELFS